MTLLAGTRLGPYEILAPLGAGGMGEVYRARDPRLKREVAVKVLPTSFAADSGRLRRFEQEAQAAGALNHPNILAVYDLGTHDGAPYVVSELLEGETLRSRIAGGAFTPRRAIGYALQVAQGLAAAHEKGIVHRDLKPENIFVTRDERVKILDFGLAKLTQPEGPGASATNLSTATPGTDAGMVLGTLGYMSPEQVRGKPADARSDIFSFGAILYEMLSGRRAFHADTAADTISAILTKEPPDLSETNRRIPESLERIVRHCLEKSPEARFHSASDIAFNLEVISEESGADTVPGLPARRRWRTLSPALLVAAGLAAMALAAVATWQWTRRSAAGGSAPETRLARLRYDTGRSEWPSWSPDGSLLTFASDRNGNFEIYVRRGDSGEDVNVTNHPDQDIQPAFSSDGNSIAFVSTRSSRTGLIKIGGTLAYNYRTYGGDLWVVPALGGSARRVASDANFPAWRPDGRGILFISGPEGNRAILEVSPDGGAPRPILPSEASSWEIDRIACSPDGRWLSFETELDGVFLMPASGGKPRALLPGFGHAWDASSRRVYFVTREPQGGSRVQSVAIGAGGTAGARRTVGLMTASLRDLAVSRDGRRIAFSDLEASRNLTRLPLAPGGGAPGGPEEPLSVGRVSDGYPSVSPDGRRIAYVNDILGQMRVWILDLESFRRERLQLPGEDVGQTAPFWMPNGREIVLTRQRAGDASRWIASTDGSRAEEVVSGTIGGTGGTNQPSPDGEKLLYPKRVKGDRQFFVFDFRSRESSQLTAWPGDKFDAVWSPDGLWIALTAIKDGTSQLFRIPASGGEPQQLTTGYERMRHPIYSPDGRWIYIQPSHRNIYRVPSGGGPLEPVTRFPDAGLFLEEPTVSPDGRYLVYCRGSGGSSLWLLTLTEAVRARD